MPLKEINEVLKKRATRCFVIALCRRGEVSFLTTNKHFYHDVKAAIMFSSIDAAVTVRNECIEPSAFIMPIKIEFTSFGEESPLYLLNKAIIELAETEKKIRSINEEYGKDFSFPALVTNHPSFGPCKLGKKKEPLDFNDREVNMDV